MTMTTTADRVGGALIWVRANGPKAALEIALDKEASRLARMKDRLVHRYRPRHHTPARTDLGPGN